MADIPDDGELVSTRQAATMLGVALRTAQLWVESGVLRAWKTAGGHRRILRSSVDELLQKRQQELAGATHRKTERHTVVVVEDEPDLLKLYEMNFEAWGLGVAVVTARDGFEGLMRVGETCPDLLITDLNMPGMDGFRMIRTLRNNPQLKDMKILVVTALGKKEIDDRGGLPADTTVFTKPVPFSTLESLVRQALNFPPEGSTY